MPGNGAPVRLGEVATVEDSYESVKTSASFNGERSILLAVQRQPNANTVQVVDAIQRIYDESTEAGKPCGMVVLTPEQARFWMNRGFRFLITSEVSAMVRMQSRYLVKSIRTD